LIVSWGCDVRKGIVAVVIVAVLLGGAWIADSSVRVAEEGEAAAQVAAALGAAEGTTSVQLGGFPFSVSYLTKSVPQASLEVASFPTTIAGTQVTVTDLRLTTGTVTMEPDSLTAQAVSGRASMSYQDLSSLVGLPITSGGQNRLQLQYSVALFGTELSAEVSAVPQVDPATHTLALTDPQVSIVGFDLPSAAVQQVVDSVVKPLDLALPYGLNLVGFEPDADQVTIVFAADSMTVPIQR
jgi:LmeA-like phospholipid-binding